MIKNAPKWMRQDEWEWTERYLQERAPKSLSNIVHARFRAAGYAGTVQIIHDLEKVPDGLKLIERLKNALRQRRYRSPGNGRKACTFSLPNATAKNLRHLAKLHEQPETLFVTNLIDGLNSATKEQQAERKQMKEAARLEREAAKQTNTLLRNQLDEAMKHLERHVELLLMCETSMETGQPPFAGDEADVRLEVEKRMKGIKRSLSTIALKHDIVSARLI